MSIQVLLEAAVRSLAMGAGIFAALHILRIRQVRAQRTAWLLALFAAVAMPTMVAGHLGPRLLPEFSLVRAVPAQHAYLGDPLPASTISPLRMAQVSASSATTLHTQVIPSPPAPKPQPITAKHGRAFSWFYAGLLYGTVAAFLLLRLAVGIAVAMRLRHASRRIVSPLVPGADIRISHRLSTPVTIDSTILLPESYSTWDEATLRIVLTHEQAHVRQADFYVQLLAALHCALFWFNPFSWWLQRRLSALNEALSDLAAVEQAESRATYAEVLLAFATTARWPMTGVAMARSSNLRPRIERLLSDTLFRQSTAGRQRLPLLAGGVAILALAASTSVTRVHAARSAATASSSTPSSAAGTATASKSSSRSSSESASASSSETSSGPSSISSGSEAIADSEGPTPAALPASDVSAKAPQDSAQAPSPQPPAPPAPPAVESTSETPTATSSQSHIDLDIDSSSKGFSYSINRDGDAFALVTGDSQVSFSGPFDDAFRRLRPSITGDFIYYRKDGKAYVIQDLAILARAKALYAPMQELGRQQSALGKQQEALGAQQEALGRQQSQVRVTTPGLTRELASLTEATDKLKQLQSAPSLDQETLSDLQSKIAEVQGRLGELQGKAGQAQAKLGEQQARLGQQQGRLGQEQGRLGEQQGKIAKEAERQLTPQLEQAIRDGKARPVE